METLMSEQMYTTGDRVRHSARPEWGVGTIVKIEPMPSLNGGKVQRLSIRFPNAGIKTIVTGKAELQRVTERDPFRSDSYDEPTVKEWDKLNGNDNWLGSVAQRKIDEAMISLPPEVRDPFTSLQKRLVLTLGLFRFDRSGRGLMDWAVAQTGLDDPLSRFTRHELEQRFDRWSIERANHLAKLVQDARVPGSDSSILSSALKDAPPKGVEAVRRITGGR